MSATYRAAGSLIVTSLAIMGTPGPATISLTAAGSTYGVRRSLGYLTGIIAGTTIVLVAVATGITAALLALPAVRPLLIGAGAAYIIWLAYHIATAEPLSGQPADSDAPGLVGGTLLGVANPKAWVAIAAVFASTRLTDDAAVDAAGKLAVLTIMIVLINTIWLAAGASMSRLLRDPRRARSINRALAAVLVAAAAVTVIH
jgi:threonine/homoserine/homoserine lactone efflux protein